MPSWLYNLIELWPILSGLTPLILLAGFYWLRTKFPDKVDFDKLTLKVEQIELDQVTTSTALQRMSEDRDSPPTRLQLMQHIAGLEGRVSAVETGPASINTQLKTANEYLQILVERGLGR